VKRLALLALVPLIVAAPASTAPSADCARTSTGLVPLTELGAQSYNGFRGGLYPGGRNSPSLRYTAQGLAAAKLVRPVSGKIVLLSIGMSNTTQEFSEFKRIADADPRKSPRVQIVDGAQGGQDAIRILDPAAPFWTRVDERLAAARATRAQVQVVWLKEAIAGAHEPFPQDARRLQGALRTIVRNLNARFPSLRVVYLSSRIYAGYATTRLNPEPYAYQSGFAVKWTIADRIEGKLNGAWLGWGPYLWADGTRARRDGLTWACADLAADGTHPAASGRRKVADALLRFFTSDRTAKSWFLG
jgi:hypothetical protein